MPCPAQALALACTALLLVLGVASVQGAPLSGQERRQLQATSCFPTFSGLLMSATGDCPSGVAMGSGPMPACSAACAAKFNPFWAACKPTFAALSFGKRLSAFAPVCAGVDENSPTPAPTVAATTAPTFDCATGTVFGVGKCPVAAHHETLSTSLTCTTECSALFKPWWNHCQAFVKFDASMFNSLSVFNSACDHPVAPTHMPTKAPSVPPTQRPTSATGLCPDADKTGLGCSLLIKTLVGMSSLYETCQAKNGEGFDLHRLLSPFKPATEYAAKTCPTTCNLVSYRDRCGVCGGDNSTCADLCPDADPTGMGCANLLRMVDTAGIKGACQGSGVDLHSVLKIYPAGKYHTARICPFSCKSHIKDACGVCGGDNHTCAEGRKHMGLCPDADETGMGCAAIKTMMSNFGKQGYCAAPRGIDMHSVMQLYPAGKFWTGTMCPTTCGIDIRDHCGVCGGNNSCTAAPTAAPTAPPCTDNSPLPLKCPMILTAVIDRTHPELKAKKCVGDGVDLHDIFGYLPKGQHMTMKDCCKSCKALGQAAPSGH